MICEIGWIEKRVNLHVKKPLMIIVIGHAAEGAKVPAVAKIKKPLDEILTTIE